MQVLLLAGPGVVMGTALTALFVQYAFPYNWTWTESLLFGAMLSATDPVAVIALLQEVTPGRAPPVCPYASDWKREHH